MPQEVLPKIALIFGLRKFKKFCKIKVVGEEWAENPTVNKSVRNHEYKVWSYCWSFDVQHLSKEMSSHNGLSTLKTHHNDPMGLHEFFHHSAIVSCITFHIWKSVDSLFINKAYRDIFRFLDVHTSSFKCLCRPIYKNAIYGSSYMKSYAWNYFWMMKKLM